MKWKTKDIRKTERKKKTSVSFISEWIELAIEEKKEKEKKVNNNNQK